MEFDQGSDSFDLCLLLPRVDVTLGFGGDMVSVALNVSWGSAAMSLSKHGRWLGGIELYPAQILLRKRWLNDKSLMVLIEEHQECH